MAFTNEYRVYYADTDAYGVVWHGSYLRWLEAGRVEYTDKVLNIDLKKMLEEGCTIPVVDLNVKYKRSARLDETVIVETEIVPSKPTTIVFKQSIRNKETNELCITAEITCVAVDVKAGKMYRRLPDFLAEACEKAYALN